MENIFCHFFDVNTIVAKDTFSVNLWMQMGNEKVILESTYKFPDAIYWTHQETMPRVLTLIAQRGSLKISRKLLNYLFNTQPII